MLAPEMVNLSRYPILDLSSGAARTLVEQCRAQIAADGACNMEAFIKPDAIASLAAEASDLMPQAYVKDYWRNAFFMPDSLNYPAGDPRSQKFHLKLSQIAADQIPGSAAIRRLYDWDPLKDFIARVLGISKLHRMADPFQSLNFTYLRDGDVQPWHFDQNVFTVTLLLQSADHGGEFEYAPQVRPRDDKDLSGVAQLFNGDMGSVKRLSRSPGTLTLFLGEFSAHRVTAVAGATPRITAILAYDEVAGRIAPLESNVIQYGERIRRAAEQQNG